MTTASLDSAALDAALQVPQTVQPAAIALLPFSKLRILFYRADASAGALAGHIMAEVPFGDAGTVTVDVSDTGILSEAEAAQILIGLKRVFLEARNRLTG